MDKKLMLETLSFVLVIIAFPVISTGATHGHAPVWWTGLALFAVASLLPVWTRYMNHAADKPRDAGMEFDDRPS